MFVEMFTPDGLLLFSKHWPSGPMLSISQHVYSGVCLFVRLFTFEVPLERFSPPLSEVGYPNFLENWNHLGKVMERSDLTYENFTNKGSCRAIFFLSLFLTNLGLIIH